MSEPIIIETPAPPTRERLVLVPLLAVSRTEGGDELLTIRTANARDATPADLLRAGYVPREVPSAEAWKAAHAAKRELIRARAALAEQPDPGTLAHLRADLRDAVKRAEKAERALRCQCSEPGDSPCRVHDEERADAAERNLSAAITRAEKAERERDALRDQIAAAGCEAAHAGERTYECDVARPCGLCRLRTRAEKAERELRDMSERAGDAERERDEAKELARVLEVERDAALDARNACAAERNEARAEVERLTAPGEGSLDNGGLVAAITRGGSYRAEDFDVLDLQAAYRLGVAHERARQQPAKDRATDEELLALAADAFQHRAHGGPVLDDLHKLARAVAARVRKEQCLVAQAVGMGADVRITRSARAVAWDIDVTRRPVAPGARYVHEVKAADVPATLARLLGEVSR